MRHGIRFGQLAPIFALANRRVVARQLRNRAAAELVQPAVADVSDREAFPVDQGHRENARHPLQFGLPPREPENVAVRLGNRPADPVRRRPVQLLFFQRGAQRPKRRVGRGFSAGLAADTIHDEEDAALPVEVVQILVIGTDQAGV